MCLDDVVKYAQILGYSFATIGIIISAYTYKKNIKIKRGEWLKNLFEKFYSETYFGEIRRNIEYNTLPDFLAVDTAKMPTDEKEKFEKREESFVNYLNFFEFISMLIRQKHINFSESDDMFGYYLKKMNSSQSVKNYIIKYGFENLENILNRYE